MGARYADVVVDISHEKVDRPFQYEIPEQMREVLRPGMCVLVPFGSGDKERKAYVVSVGNTCNFAGALKQIREIVPDAASAQSIQLRLAVFMRERFGGTLIQCIKTVMPARKSAKKVEHRKVVLTATREEAIATLGEAQRKKQVAKVRLLESLLEEGELPYGLVTGKLMVGASTVNSLEKAGVLKKEVITSFRNPVKLAEQKKEEKTLSDEQQYVIDTVRMDMEAGEAKTYLLHGITGSGKTEVYIRLIEDVVARGKQAIVLIPEIALTYQTLIRFYRHFGDRVSVLNSSLTPAEKYDQCERARQGEIDVIIGPRSALFVPFANVGIIIIDEEHEASYKSESTPKYHAVDMALELARLHGAGVVLGSATPSVNSYYRARNGEYTLFEMTKRLTGGELPVVHTVDLREELRKGNRSIFSGKLKELLTDRLAKGQQSMLFINRRGTAGFISCRSCGFVVKCPHCDVSLSEHRGGKMVCHYCGYETVKVTNCPECGSKYISGFRAGTEQIEDRLKQEFPGIRVLRMDADTTKTKESYEEILSAFGNGEADVLVGTQMIVKGHDFPGVTLVGVLAADLSLAVNDYRAGERTFQLLTQAAGRAGRGEMAGEAVIQTYQPEHYAIIHASNQDYKGFYEEEEMYRDMMNYPPVAHMVAVQIYSKVEARGEKLSEQLATMVRSLVDTGLPIRERMQVIGPAKAGIGKIGDIYRHVFYVKDRNYDALSEMKDKVEEQVNKMALRDISVQFDFDPMNTL